MPTPVVHLFSTGLFLVAVSCASHAQEPYGDIADLSVAKPEDKANVATVPPPAGSIVLFDGSNLDAWVKTDGKTPASWQLVDGGAMQVRGGGIMTRQSFGGHFKLHVEFRVP